MDVNTFVNPQGRIGPDTFLKAALVLIGIGVVIGILPAIHIAFSFLGILGLVLIYPWVVIWVKRLHDAGKSGWWFLLVLAIWIVMSWIVSSIVAVLFMPDIAATAGAAQGTDFQSMMNSMTAASRATILPSAILNAIVAFAFVYIANMVLKSEPGANQFGPPPGASGESAPAASQPGEPQGDERRTGDDTEPPSGQA